MTERERKILIGKKIDPVTADEAAIATAIDNAGSGGGGSLPEPGNAGNVLTSTGDGWESAAPQSGGGEYVVTIVAETVSDETVYHAEHNGEPVTIADIFAAKQAGGTVIAVVAEADYPVEYLCLMCTAQICLFTNTTNLDSDNVIVDSFVGFASDNDDVWAAKISSLPVIPIASVSDNGKVLGVEDGEYALVDIGSPFTVHFTTDGTNYSTTETAGDIVAALDAGRAVLGICHITGTTDNWVNIRIETVGETEQGGTPTGGYIMYARYYDLTNSLDVPVLLAAVNNNSVFTNTYPNP